jgi:hypothetical protein
MIALLVSLMLSADTLVRADSLPARPVPDTVQRHVVRVDTLREVEVRPDSVLPVMKAIQRSLERQQRHDIPKPPSLSQLLEKLWPGFNDKVTHPFAIKARRRERKHKRDREALKHYDEVKTFDDLLREAIIREGLPLPPASQEKTK